MPVDWDRITREEFDSLCESLVGRVARQGDKAAIVRTYEGSGGDGGRDVTVHDRDGLTIYQLKHFPGRISDRSPKRRSQVESSLKAAVKHEPTRWVLVVPTKLNQNEHSWLDGLRKTVPFDVDLWDIPRLNDHLATNVDLLTLHLRRTDQYLLEAVKEHNAEKAVLDGPYDLAERVGALDRRADEQDPDWRWEFATQGGTVVHTLVAKHAEAHLRNPITIDFDIDFGSDREGQEAQEQWLAATKYGAPGPVRLPPGSVRKVVVTGPDFVAGEHDVAALELTPEDADIPAQPVRLRVLDSHGNVLHELRGRTERWGRGTNGHHVTALVAGLDIKLTVDTTGDGGGMADIDLALSRCDTPEQALAAVRAVIDLTPSCTLAVDLAPYQCHITPPAKTGDDEKQLRRAEQVILDIIAVATALDAPLAVPASLTKGGLRELRRAALLLAGEVVEIQRGTITASFTPSDDDVVLGMSDPDAKWAFSYIGDHQVPVLGHMLRLPELAIYARKATCVAAGPTPAFPGAVATIKVTPVDGEGWLARKVNGPDDIDLTRDPASRVL